MEMVSIPDILTTQEVADALVVWAHEKDGPNLNKALAEKVIVPILPRINAAVGKKCNPAALARMVAWIFRQVEEHGQDALFTAWNTDLTALRK